MDEVMIDCPYCGENISVLVDNSVEEQEYFEDCSVCCCPILFISTLDELNHTSLVVKRDNE